MCRARNMDYFSWISNKGGLSTHHDGGMTRISSSRRGKLDAPSPECIGAPTDLEEGQQRGVGLGLGWMNRSNGPFIVSFPIKNGDFPSFFVCLPEGRSAHRSTYIRWNQLDWSTAGRKVETIPSHIIHVWWILLDIINEYQWYIKRPTHFPVLVEVAAPWHSTSPASHVGGKLARLYEQWLGCMGYRKIMDPSWLRLSHIEKHKDTQ